MAYPQTLCNEMRMYDQSMYDWLGTMQVNYGDIAGEPRRNFGILRCYATPRRAVSTMENMLIRKGWLNPTTAGQGSESGESGTKTWKKVPLPFASIWRQTPKSDPERFVRSPFRPMGISSDLRTQSISRYPTPIVIPYSIDFWFKKKFTDAYIMEWILSQIGDFGAYENEFFVKVLPTDKDGNTPWGSKMIPVLLENIADNSDLEPGENDRALRITIDFLMKAWIFHIPQQYKTVLEFETEIEQDSSFGEPDGELYADKTWDSFNLLSPEMWTLNDTVGDSTYSYQGDQVSFVPGTDPHVNLLSFFAPVEAATYSIKGNFKIEGTLTVTVLNSVGAQLASTSFTASWQENSFSFSFSTSVNDVKVQVKLVATSRLLIYNLELKKA